MLFGADFWASHESRWLGGVTSDGKAYELNNLPAVLLLAEKRLSLLVKYAPLIFTEESKANHIANIKLLFELVDHPIAHLPALNATVINRPVQPNPVV